MRRAPTGNRVLALGLTVSGLAAACSSPTQPTCNYSVSPAGISLPAAGGSVTVAVTTGSSCTWLVISTTPWLTVSGTSGTGDGTVSVSAGANGQTPRSATLTIATHAVGVAQEGLPLPTFALSGRVTDAFIGQSPGLSGVSVTAADGPSQGSSTTDAFGNYAIPGLPAGTYTVTFAKAAYTTVVATAAVSGPTALSMVLSLEVPAAPSSSDLTGYWSGTGTYPNDPFRLLLVQQGETLRGMYADQHDASSSVSGAFATPDFVLRVDFGDAVLFLECAVEDAREINGVQRTSALGNRPWPFTMKR